ISLCSLCALWLLAPLGCLNLNQNFDRATDQPAGVFDTEIEAVDRGHRRKVEDLVAMRRAAAVGYRHVERDLAALALDCQRSIDTQHVSVSAATDACALKMNLRMICGVEKILRSQMLVAHFDAGRDARGVDRRLDRRAVDVVFVERYLSAEVGEAAFD